MASSQWPGGDTAVRDREAGKGLTEKVCWSKDLEEVKGQSTCDLSEEHFSAEAQEMKRL